MLETTLDNLRTDTAILYAHQDSGLQQGRTSSGTSYPELFSQKDRLTIGGNPEDPVVYSASATQASDTLPDKLREYVAELLRQQGVSTTLDTGDREIDLTELSPEEAQDLVAEDGYFGVEQTSERIFQFAVGIAGGDPSRIDAIREGVNKGFEEALQAFGGWLPDISYQTMDAVMEKLDTWVEQGREFPEQIFPDRGVRS